MALWLLRLVLAASLCYRCCWALFADAYKLLMAPVKELVFANRDCGWVNPADLAVKAQTSSAFEQRIEVREDSCGNRVLMMGGYLQCHQADEHIYHEMMVHPALVAFAAAQGRAASSVFLGGSGDGAGPRELLRWKQLDKVTMVDIDYEVTRFTKEWIPSFSGGSFEDPRLHQITGDAVAYLRNLEDGVTFDVLILDFPDAFESKALEQLYGEEFYRLCFSRMHAGSVLVTQSGPCTEVTMAGIRASCSLLESLIVPNLAKVFDHVDVIFHPMATWKPDKKSLSEWSTFAMARIGEGSRGVMPLSEAADAAEGRWLGHARGDGKLRYYNAAVHRAATQTPRPLSDRLQKLLPKPGRSEL